MRVSPYYLALAGAICVGVGAQVLLKIGAAGAESVAAQFLRVSTTAGLLLYLGSAVLYVIALRKMSISIAFPTVSLGYVLIAAIDYFFFKESLEPIREVSTPDQEVGLRRRIMRR